MIDGTSRARAVGFAGSGHGAIVISRPGACTPFISESIDEAAVASGTRGRTELLSTAVHVDESDVDRLVDILRSDPVAAAQHARAAIDASPRDQRELARLRWVLGLAQREIGVLDEARRELSAAADLARSEDLCLWAQIATSLSFLLGQVGELDAAAQLLGEAAPHLDGAERAGAIGQLGIIRYWQGELVEAAALIGESCETLNHFGDRAREARFRGNLGAVLSLLGEFGRADHELRQAASLADDMGMRSEAGVAWSNLGYVATLRGDLPGALAHFSLGEQRFVDAQAESLLPRLHADHAQALAEAGLFEDADALVARAISMYRVQGQQTELAGTLLTLAEIKLVQGDLDGASAAAEEAAGWYQKQGREQWVVVARSLSLQADARSARREPSLPEALDSNAAALRRIGLVAAATRASLIAAQMRAESGEGVGRDVVPGVLRRAAATARSSDRILLAHIDAISAINAHDHGAARRAVTRGLGIAMAGQSALGSIETRAHAAVHGYALTEMGARLAIQDGRPRELLARIEASRLMSSRMPDVRPPDDPQMAAMLTELRSHNGTIADPSSSDEQRREAEHSRVRVERDVRRRSRTVRGDVDAPVGLRDELGTALALLGDRHLLAHASLDGHLYAVSAVARRLRLHDLGPIEGITERVEGIAFSLNRLNRLQGSDASRLAAAEMLYVMADELAELLVPAVVADAMNPVVVVPTAVLHDVPWGLLPPLGGRAVSVNPSVTAWARAERTRKEREAGRSGLRSVGFMAGPGLEFADFEVEQLATEYIDPEVFTGPDATGAACVGLLGRADLVHIACHGQFRTDNPMFSSLHLADGPLIVHDLERLDRMPETVVLPACSVANAKAVQGGSLLGLATALITLGACNVIAPLTPINDASSVTVMQRLHRELVAGRSPAASLAVATMSHDLVDPTAAAFITLGA